MRHRVEPVHDRARRTLAWQVWERMLEIEFIDRSVAFAGKAFVSFFPLVIVVAAFVPPRIRASILTTLTDRLGVRGTRARAREGGVRFARRTSAGRPASSASSSRSSSRVRSPPRSNASICEHGGDPARPGRELHAGPLWLGAMLGFMALMGTLRGLLGDGGGFGAFIALSLIATPALWTFTAWFMLEREVRWRVLIPSGIITGLAMLAYGASAAIWMPNMVSTNEAQFGFFGVALALVSWFSGAALCIGIGACAGPVLAEDTGPVGRFIRGRHVDGLVEGARPPLPGPTQVLRLRDAFLPIDDNAASPSVTPSATESSDGP